MIRVCRWGMHRPGAHKVFHRGHSFTRCADCGATLIVSDKGWVTLPSDKKVTWRDRTDADRHYAFSANHRRARLRMNLAATFGRPRVDG